MVVTLGAWVSAGDAVRGGVLLGSPPELCFLRTGRGGCSGLPAAAELGFRQGYEDLEGVRRLVMRLISRDPIEAAEQQALACCKAPVPAEDWLKVTWSAAHLVNADGMKRDVEVRPTSIFR